MHVRHLRLVKAVKVLEKKVFMARKTDRVKRSVELPEEIWNYLEADATRTFRSINGMLSALLSVIYLDADIETRGYEQAVESSPVAKESRQAKRNAM